MADVEELFQEALMASSVRFGRRVELIIKDNISLEKLPVARIAQALSAFPQHFRLNAFNDVKYDQVPRKSRSSESTMELVEKSFALDLERCGCNMVEFPDVNGLATVCPSTSSNVTTASTKVTGFRRRKMKSSSTILKDRTLSSQTKFTSARLVSLDKNGPENKKPSRGGTLEQLFSGAFAGIVSRSAVAPLDLIKTVLMSGKGSAMSTLNAGEVFLAIIKRDGWKGLFRGNGINCLRVGPNKAIELFVFENMKRFLNQEGNPLNGFSAPLAGGAAGIAGTIATYPLELMRTRISVQPHLYQGVTQTLQKIIREEGFFALYRGITPSVIGVFPYAASNYFVYDGLRTAYLKSTGSSTIPPFQTLMFGAVAAAVSSAFTFPLEMARRQLQLAGQSLTLTAPQVLLHIYKENGFFALYRGLGTTWLKLIPAAGISFVCYEAARVALGVDDQSFARSNSETESRSAGAFKLSDSQIWAKQLADEVEE